MGKIEETRFGYHIIHLADNKIGYLGTKILLQVNYFPELMILRLGLLGLI